ncbi:MAG: hypothetical protein WBN03_06315 [Desulfobacterales bacterium]
MDFFFFSASGAHDFEKLADLNVFRKCSKFFCCKLVPALRAIGVVEFSEKFGAQVYNFAYGKKEADRPQESYENAIAKLRGDCSDDKTKACHNFSLNSCAVMELSDQRQPSRQMDLNVGHEALAIRAFCIPGFLL